MSYMVIHTNGKGDVEYPLNQLPALLGELTGVDDIEVCVALAHESEWCLSFHTNGCLLWENTLGELQDTWYLESVSHKTLLRLWRLLAQGNIDEVQKENWCKGDPIYGV